MGGLSCYTMCTSPKHAAPAAQALRRGSVLTNAHRRQETVHRLGSNSKVPRVRKLLLPPPLRVRVVIRFWITLRRSTLRRVVFPLENCNRATTECALGVDLSPSHDGGFHFASSAQRQSCNKTHRPSRGICFFKKQTPVKGPSASDVGDHSCLGLEGLLLGWSSRPSRERIPFSCAFKPLKVHKKQSG